MISWRSLLAMCSSGGPTFSATVYQLSPAIPSTWQNTPWNLHPLTVISWQVSQDSYEVNEIRHQEIAGEDLQPKNFQIGLIVTCSQRCIQIRHRRNSRSGFPPHQTTPRVSKAVEPPKVAGLPQPEPTTTTLKLYTYCKLDCFVATHRNSQLGVFLLFMQRDFYDFFTAPNNGQDFIGNLSFRQEYLQRASLRARDSLHRCAIFVSSSNAIVPELKDFGIYITSMLKPWGHTRGSCYFGPSLLNCFEFALDGIFHFNFFGTEISLMSSMTWPCHMWFDPLRKCGGHETAWWRLHDAWLDGLQPHVGMNLQDVHKTSIGWWNFEGEPWWQPLCEIFM